MELPLPVQVCAKCKADRHCPTCQVHGKVHDGEQAIGSLSPFIESMQNGMTSMISCCCAAVSLATPAKLQTLTAKSTLIDVCESGRLKDSSSRMTSGARRHMW